jgi:2-methylfumaryl-CoA isomerase
MSSDPGGAPPANGPPATGPPAIGPAAWPLAGLRVIEVGSFVAIPSAGLALRQAGARVIRVDPVGGAPDVNRWPLGRDGRSLYWAGLNRGKESVTLDLAAPDGQSALQQLICGGGPGGGILLSNLAGKTWLSDDVLRAARPDLVYVQVTGRPDGGPAVDYTINAASGLAYATGPADGTAPVNQALPAWDLLAGSQAVFAVLAALRRREATGTGAFVQIALEDVATATLATLGYLPEAQLTGTSRPPHGNDLYGTFGTALPLADGSQVMVIALTGRQWRSLQEVTGTAGVVAALQDALGADFRDEGSRYKYRRVLFAVLEPWFAARSLPEVSAALRGSHVLWAPFRHFAEVARDLAAGAGSGVVSAVTEPGFGENLVTEGPLRHGGSWPPPALAPRLGEHTAAVLAELAAEGPAAGGPAAGGPGDLTDRAPGRDTP